MQQRYYSLDVFRGATVALMILVNYPGSDDHVFSALTHANWNGFSGADIVFPFFLFAVGNAMAFVMPRFEAAGAAEFWKKVIKRTLLIFGIGVLLHWSPFVKWDGGILHWKPLDQLRIMGILQRIALCYFFASLIVYYAKIRQVFFICTVLLLGYWAVVLAFGDYTIQGFIGTYVDNLILGNHIYKKDIVPFDPEGLFSTIPAIVQVIFGYFVGLYIQQKGKTFEMLAHLLIGGCILMACGLMWDVFFPINKKMWTSSYVVYSTGLAMLVISMLIYLIEFKNKKGVWSKFFDVFGKNPLFIFVLSGVIIRLQSLIRIHDGITTKGEVNYISPFGWFYKHICDPLFAVKENGSLLYALSFILLLWAIGYWMDKKKIYIKV